MLTIPLAKNQSSLGARVPQSSPYTAKAYQSMTTVPSFLHKKRGTSDHFYTRKSKSSRSSPCLLQVIKGRPPHPRIVPSTSAFADLKPDSCNPCTCLPPKFPCELQVSFRLCLSCSSGLPFPCEGPTPVQVLARRFKGVVAQDNYPSIPSFFRVVCCQIPFRPHCLLPAQVLSRFCPVRFPGPFKSLSVRVFGSS